jgi:aminoglycoside phosphotransferase (APT) family kinase protein
MTTSPSARSPVADFPAAAASALEDAAERCALDIRGARLIRLFATAVYHLPAAEAVARIAPVTSPESVTRLATSVSLTRWLAAVSFPAVEPLSVDQPVTSHGCAVTFWRYLPQEGPQPVPADLGRLLSRLHHLGPPPVTLPAYRPMVSLRHAVESSRAIDDDERAWLRDRCAQLLDAYDHLQFVLPPGLIHGDAWRGNLLRDGHRVVLADWDAASTGPREVDLIPTLQGIRFGLPEYQRDAFIAAYTRDIRSWDGYRVLRDIREMSTTSALLRDGHADVAAQRELQIRLRSLRRGDARQWNPF